MTSVADTHEKLPACWQEVHDALEAGIDRLILFGVPGTGKTYAGLNYGNTEAGAFRLICTDDMTNADVTGCWQPNEHGSWSWLEGSAIRAWKGNGTIGGRLVVDEIDKAGGDVFATLLAMTDSPESAKWEHPHTRQVLRPMDGFSVVMTTNIEQMSDLPIALKDRFPVCVRINEPHPTALARLSADLRDYARQMADAGERRISLRAFYAFDQLRTALGTKKAAQMVFRDRAKSVVDAIAINTMSEPK